MTATARTLFVVLIAATMLLSPAHGQEAPAAPGVVFVDRMESLDSWRWNDDVEPVLDKSYRKTGYGCINVKFTIDKSDPGTAWLSRPNVGLDRTPEYLQIYVLVPRWQKFAWGEARIRIIVQDADGTAKMTFLSGLYEGTDGRDSPIFPRPWYYTWPKMRVRMDSLEPYWPGGNGTLDGIETISLEMPHRVEEYMYDGKYEFRIDELAAVYPNAKEHIDAWSGRLAARAAALQTRLDAVTTEGTWRRYPQATIAVVDLFCGYAREEAAEDKPVRAARQLEYVESLCDDLEAKLTRVDQGEAVWPESVPSDNLHLKVVEGDFMDGDRPVYINGFCGWPSAADLATWVRMGLNGLAMECGPGHTMPSENQVQPPNHIVGLLKAAAENNMACDLLLTPHSIPACAREKWPDMSRSGLRVRRNQFLPWDVDSAGFRELLVRHMDVTIPAVKSFTNLLSYDLTNELWYLVLGDFEPDAFRRWLSGHYGSIEALNGAWGTAFESFEKVQYQAGVSRSAEDVFLYNRDRVTEFYRWLTAEMLNRDDTRLIYAKIHGAWRRLMSVDKVALSRIFTGIGSDCFSRLDNPDDNQVMDLWTTAIVTHLYRSLAPGNPIIDSEQHMIWYGHVVTPEYIPGLMWWRAVLGCDANYVWVWGRTIENFEECILTQPWAVQGFCQTSLDIQRLGSIVSTFQRFRPDVLLVDNGWRLPDAYKLCSYAGPAFDILPPEAMNEEIAGKYKTIVVPPEADLNATYEGYLQAAEGAGAKIIRLADTADLAPVTSAMASSVSSLVEPQRSVINFTVLDAAGKSMTFVMNIHPEPVGAVLRRPADGTLVNLLNDQPIDGQTIELTPSVPLILTVR